MRCFWLASGRSSFNFAELVCQLSSWAVNQQNWRQFSRLKQEHQSPLSPGSLRPTNPAISRRIAGNDLGVRDRVRGCASFDLPQSTAVSKDPLTPTLSPTLSPTMSEGSRHHMAGDKAGERGQLSLHSAKHSMAPAMLWIATRRPRDRPGILP